MLNIRVIWILVGTLAISAIVAAGFDRSEDDFQSTQLPNLSTATCTCATPRATALVQTIQAVLGIDPLHTPRPVVIIRTPTPSATTTKVGSQTVLPEEVTPTLSPRFEILSYGTSSTFPLERVCVFMEPIDFWVPGDNAWNLAGRLTFGAKIVVDDAVSFTGNDLSQGQVDTLYYVWDDQGNVLGTYGGTVHVCFDTNDLEIGQHEATIEVVTGSGTKHTYNWTFTIEVSSSSTTQ